MWLQDKRGLSLMIGYVLLIVIAVVMSMIVYQYIKTYIPKEGLDCPEGVSVFIKEAKYDCVNNNLDVTIKNNGRFNIAGYFIHATTSADQELATLDLSGKLAKTNPGGEKYGNSIVYAVRKNFLTPASPNEKTTKFDLGSLDTIYKIEIIPVRFQDEEGKTRFVSCSNARVEEVLSSCWEEPEVCVPDCSGRECGPEPVCGVENCPPNDCVGEYGEGYDCNGTGTCVPEEECIDTCESLGYVCGDWTICGVLETCPPGCEDDYTCDVFGQCVEGCTPATCTGLGYECGTWANGTCDGTLDCGDCDTNYGCVSGICEFNTTEFLQSLGAISWWKLEGNANDEIGDNDGTIFGADCSVAGKYGQGCSFDGSTDYIDVGNNPSLQITGSFSIAAWIYLSSNDDWTKIISKGERTWGLEGKAADSGQGFTVYDTTWRTAKGGTYSTGSWVHVVGTWNEADRAVKVYTNGDLGSITSSATFINEPSAYPVNIGRNSLPNQDQYLNGIIDEVIIFGETLSDGEVETLYNLDLS